MLNNSFLNLNQALSVHSLFEEEHKNIIKRQVIAFDLDHTLIDSSHRSFYNEDGSFDLETWIKFSTWEHIKKDTLLPLYHHYLAFKKAGFTIIAVTAREMSEADFRYLKENKLEFDYILERGNSKDLDENLKDGKLKEFLSQEGRIPFLFYDDKKANLIVAEKYGFKAMNAHYLNLKLVVKDYESIAKLEENEVNCFAPKEEDLATGNVVYNK